ncbi:MAG: class I SAM-dependent methyltransferase [Bacteroidetes bacterium]|jgi:ubiquinone/menaquinone biosynthesis C-methylase UbiE|nr:class I SAM-dependent methyltransferase [Bacteroidota bacterium]
MDKYKETFETWNKVATLYQSKFMDLDLYNHTYNQFCNSIDKHNAKILEIACGPGNITQYLLSQRQDFDVFGIDIAPNMIELAKKNNPKANFALMDCRQIHLLNEKYDGIIGGFCLPYLSQAESKKLIADAYQLLNNKGVLYLSFVEGNPSKSEFKINSNGRVYFYYHDIETVKEQLINENFHDMETFNVEYQTSGGEFEVHTILTTKK